VSKKTILIDECRKVSSIDEPGAGGACHQYSVDIGERPVAFAMFQKGAIEENGVNGCQNEDLLVIVKDRLASFQAGDYPCYENKQALHHIEAALDWLNKRTVDRRTRGVEGQPKSIENNAGIKSCPIAF